MAWLDLIINFLPQKLISRLISSLLSSFKSCLSSTISCFKILTKVHDRLGESKENIYFINNRNQFYSKYIRFHLALAEKSLRDRVQLRLEERHNNIQLDQRSLARVFTDSFLYQLI